MVEKHSREAQEVFPAFDENDIYETLMERFMTAGQQATTYAKNCTAIQ